MSATTPVFGPLRAASRAVAGQSKDWIAVALPDRLVIGYGRTGHALRCTVVPQARCQQQDPHVEGQRRQHDKQAEGYHLVSGTPDPWIVTFLKQAGGVPLPPGAATPTAADAAADRGGLWWELIAQPTLNRDLSTLVAIVGKVLAEHLRTSTRWYLEEDFLQVQVDSEALRLPLEPPARHGGCVQSLGAQALLLALSTRLPDGCLRLADARGKALTPADFLKAAEWLQDPARRALAEALDLVGPALDFTRLGAPTWFF
ncbi:MAG: hypothetical protein U1F76_14190 [Candidatus Competibacteraceae bacterium]